MAGYLVGKSEGKGKAIHLIMDDIYLACTVPKDKEVREKYKLDELVSVKVGEADENLTYYDLTCKNCIKIALKDGLAVDESGWKEKKKDEPKNNVASKKKTKNKKQSSKKTSGKKQEQKQTKKSTTTKKKQEHKRSNKKEEKKSSSKDKKSTNGKVTTKDTTPGLSDVEPTKDNQETFSPIEPLPDHVLVYSAATARQKPLVTVIADSIEQAKEKIEKEFHKSANRLSLWNSWNSGGRVVLTRQVPKEFVREFLDRRDRQDKLLSAKLSFEEILLGVGNYLILIENHLRYFRFKDFDDTEKKKIKIKLKTLPQIPTERKEITKTVRRLKRRIKLRRSRG